MRTVLLPNGVEVTGRADFELKAESVLGLSIESLCQPFQEVIESEAYVMLSTPPAEESIGLTRSLTDARFPESANDGDVIYVDAHTQIVEFDVIRPVSTSVEQTTSLLTQGHAFTALTWVEAEHKDYTEGPVCTLRASCPPDTAMETVIFECHLAISMLRGAHPELNTPEDALRHLRHGVWNRFLGQAEAQWLEFKREMYRLKEDPQKRELALDISSFANSQEGGIIIIGFETKPDPHGRDAVVKVRGTRGAEKSIPQIENLISQHVYPAPEHVSVQVFVKDDREVVTIYIPPQSLPRRPFLVLGQKISTDKYSGSGFTWVERISGSKREVSAARIHSLIQGGSSSRV